MVLRIGTGGSAEALEPSHNWYCTGSAEALEPSHNWYCTGLENRRP